METQEQYQKDTTSDPEKYTDLLAHVRAFLQQAEVCGFECSGGPLEMNKAFAELKEWCERRQHENSERCA